MEQDKDQPLSGGSGHTIRLFASPPHGCAYLDEREAVTQFIDPSQTLDSRLYSQLVDAGFRRSGEYVYRPRCNPCQACRPARIPTAAFRPSRSQRRTWRRNLDLEVSTMPMGFREEHFALYRRYIASRHAGGDMDVTQPERYKEFLLSSWSDTWCYEFRLDGRLLAVAVVDRLIQGLSAVYTFFDPEYANRGLGTFAVLWEIAEAHGQGLSWLYLGYWIAECAKMSYKSQFQPLEIYRDGMWQTLAGYGAGNPRP
jgi:arginyl-tRNA--protein-N-Asp/Glu arginylyltransferase